MLANEKSQFVNKNQLIGQTIEKLVVRNNVTCTCNTKLPSSVSQISVTKMETALKWLTKHNVYYNRLFVNEE